MRPRKVAELMSAARRGPVIVVNVCTDKCDALILRSASNDVAHVPLLDLSHADVAQLHRLMLTTLREKQIRQRGMSRVKGQPNDHFEEILAALWNKLVKPILDFLGYEVRGYKINITSKVFNLVAIGQASYGPTAAYHMVHHWGTLISTGPRRRHLSP